MIRWCGAFVSIVVLLIVAATTPASADMDAALAAYDRGDMKTAFVEFMSDAERGDAEAQYFIGSMFLNGLGTKANLAEAAVWFRKAAEQGDAESQYQLSELLYWGDGVAADLVESAHWTRLAAEQGHAEAQYALGNMLYTGEGVPLNLEESAHWTLLSAEQGHVEAQYAMALNYYLGEGVPENIQESNRWLELAANQGHVDAQFDMGDTFYTGNGVAVDLAEARRWYEMAAAQGHLDAQARLDQISGNVVPSDGPLDPSLVGLWEIYVLIAQDWRRWTLAIAADGTYEFHDNDVFGHSGTFEGMNGTWQLVSQTNDWTDGGTYQMPNTNVFNMVGSLGPGSWHRVAK